MPVPDFCMDASPKLYHTGLKTTFCGITHPLSMPHSKVHQYRGIKYASIPARFRQAQLCTSYPPITDASRYGPICPQPRHSQSVEERLFGVPPNLIPAQDLKQDEFECLNLNITLPAGLTSHSRVPVMLWIHGGGDRGSGSQWFYDGGALGRRSITFGKPVIFVTFNFRLGLLGFATHPLIRDDNKAAGEEGTGNYGLRDQRKAMEWLHQHIGEFGGDPNKITIFGAGSGGADIIHHLLSRANVERPLFHNAIVQSAVFEPVLTDVSSAGWHLSRVMSALQITSVEKFRQIEVEKLLGLGQNLRAVDDAVFFRDGWQTYFSPQTAQRHIQYHTERSPRPIGTSHHSHPSSPSHNLLTPGRHSKSKSRSRSQSVLRSVASLPKGALFKPDLSHQPLIIGDCSSDSLLWSMPISFWTAPGVVRRLKAICQSLSKTQCVLRAYDITSNTPDDEIMERVLDLVNDARVAWPTQCVVENALRERGGKNVWRFVFDQEGPSRGMPHHAADLMYLFDTVPLPESAFATNMDSNLSYEASDDEGDCPSVRHDIELEGASNLTTNPSETFTFSSAFVEKCQKISERGRTSPDSDEWLTAVVDEYSYARVRDAMQERWISFAYGEAPWRDDRIFVFGPEGEVGERSKEIFSGRRRRHIWKEVLEPLGYQLVQKFGIELSRGPAMGPDRR